MTYDETLEYIHSVSWLGSKPGLSRVSELLSLIGDPQKSLRCVHVTGTNGKGSVCEMLSCVLREAGYKTALYTSPYIERFNERICVDGEPISDCELCDLVGYIKPFAESMDDKPTEFELITALAFEYFKRKQVDIVVLEVGMGGEFDATNVITSPLLSVVTSVGLDHTRVLGDTVEKIAATKGGIIKPGCPALYGGSDESVERVLNGICEDKHCDFTVSEPDKAKNVSLTLDGCSLSYKEFSDVSVPLLGTFQKVNLITVLDAVRILRTRGIAVSDGELKSGLKKAVWRARCELFSKEPLIILDGAHNPMGMTCLAESIRLYFPGRKVNFVTGTMKDKDYLAVASIISPLVNRAYTLTPGNPRAMDAKELAAVYRERVVEAESFSTINEAVSRAYADTVKENGILVAAGSLYMYGDVRKALFDEKR